MYAYILTMIRVYLHTHYDADGSGLSSNYSLNGLNFQTLYCIMMSLANTEFKYKVNPFINPILFEWQLWALACKLATILFKLDYIVR